MSGGSSLTPSRSPRRAGPQAGEEHGLRRLAQGRGRLDVVVPRASTHLEYTDINYALPASRYGQDVASFYVQAWLDRYLKHDGAQRRLPARRSATSSRSATGKWAAGRCCGRAPLLSRYYCSAYALRTDAGRPGRRRHLRRRLLTRPKLIDPPVVH